MDESAEPRLVAECFWPGVSAADVAGAASRLVAWIRAAGPRTTGADPGLACEGWILMPGDEVVLLVFRSTSAELVRAACAGAQVDVERVVEALVGTGDRRWGPPRADG